jgi:hypothetical protein
MVNFNGPSTSWHEIDDGFEGSCPIELTWAKIMVNFNGPSTSWHEIDDGFEGS